MSATSKIKFSNECMQKYNAEVRALNDMVAGRKTVNRDSGSSSRSPAGGLENSTGISATNNRDSQWKENIALFKEILDDPYSIYSNQQKMAAQMGLMAAKMNAPHLL